LNLAKAVKETNMIKGIHKLLGLGAIIACGMTSQAFAQDKACIALKSTAETANEVVGADGKKSTQMVAAEKVVPGVEVLWTVTASNTCQKPSDNVVINNPVPAHMSYVSGSATGAGAAITFSLDGKTFATADALTVIENGATRKARADEYRLIRWTFKAPVAPGGQAIAQFRAVLN
jgi:uncharacterized repeat protein (TIGR01451 family)